MRISIILSLFIIGNTLKSQNCFQVIANNTGFAINTQELETKSCELLDTISNEFRFKVFDFGFYRLDKYKEQSYNPNWLNAKNSASGNSKFHLLFGRIVQDKTPTTKFIVNLSLPKTGFFSCLTDEDLERVKIELEFTLNQEFRKSGSIESSELKAINFLIAMISDLKVCCVGQRSSTSCDVCASEATVKGILENNGFQITQIQSITINQLYQNDSDGDDVIESSKFNVTIGNEQININESIKTIVNYINSNNLTPTKIKAHIYANSIGKCTNFLQNISQEEDNDVMFKVYYFTFEGNNYIGTKINYEVNKDKCGLLYEAVKLFLSELGVNSNTIQKVLTIQNSTEPDKLVFKCKYAMIKDTTEFKKHQNNWTKNELDSYNNKANASSSPTLCVKYKYYNWEPAGDKFVEIEGISNLQLKYYPSRNFSIGIVKTGFDHYVEAGSEVIDGLIRKIFGKDDVVSDMHTHNAEFFMENFKNKCN